MALFKTPVFLREFRSAISSVLVVLIISCSTFILIGKPAKFHRAESTNPLEQIDIPRYVLDGDSFVLLPESGATKNRAIAYFEVGEGLPPAIPVDTELTLSRGSKSDEWKLNVRGLVDSAAMRIDAATDSITADVIPQGTLISFKSSYKNEKQSKAVLALQYNKATGRVLNLLLLEKGVTPAKRSLAFPKSPSLMLNNNHELERLAHLLAKDDLWSDALALKMALFQARKKWRKGKDISPSELVLIKKSIAQLRVRLSIRGEHDALRDSLAAYLELGEQIARDASIASKDWRSFGRMLVILRQIQLESTVSSGNYELEIKSAGEVTSSQPTARMTTMASAGTTATISSTPTLSVTPPQSTPTNLQATPATNTPTVSPTSTSQITPTLSVTPTAAPTMTVCPDYGVRATHSDEPNGESRFQVNFSWHTVYGTSSYKVVVIDRNSGIEVHAAQPLLAYHQTYLPAGEYVVWIFERERLPQGQYIRQCVAYEFEVSKQCLPFKNPTVERLNRNGLAEFRFEWLRSASSLGYEIVELNPGKMIPALSEGDNGTFSTDETKACFMWQKGSGRVAEYKDLFAGSIKKVSGRFADDKTLVDLTESAFGKSHLVCTYLCPTCNPQLALEGFADNFIRGWVWSNGKQVAPREIKPLSPAPGANVYSAFPQFYWRGAATIGKSSPIYSFILRRGVWGEVVADAPYLTLPYYLHDKALAPGNYTYWLKMDLPSSGVPAKWSAPISFTVSLRAPTLLSPEQNTLLHSLTPRFEWSNSKNPRARYDLQIDNLTSKTSFLLEKGIETNNYVLSKKLPYGQEFSWKVRENDRGQVGAWSISGYFKTPSDKIRLIFPQTQTLTDRPIFTWTKIPHAKHEIWIEYIKPQQKISSLITPEGSLSLDQSLQVGRTIRVWLRAWVEENGKYIPRAWQPPVEIKVSN